METINTLALADAVKSLIPRKTYYSLAKALGVDSETARCWYVRGTVMDDKVGIRCAEMLNLDSETVLLWLQVERVEKRGDAILSQHWRQIAQRNAA